MAPATSELESRLLAALRELSTAFMPIEPAAGSIARVLVDGVAAAVGALRVVVVRLGANGLLTPEADLGHDAAAHRQFSIHAGRVALPSTDAVRDGHCRYFESVAAAEAAYPHLASEWARLGAVRLAFVPLLARDDAARVLVVHLPGEGGVCEATRSYLETAGALACGAYERAALASAMREESRFVSRVTDASPDMLYVFDLLEQRNVWANRALTSVLGYDREGIDRMGGNLFAETLHPEDLARYPGHVARIVALADGEVAEFEYRMRRSDGEWRWLRSRDMVFRRDAAGRPVQIVGAAVDVSATRLAAERLRESEERFRIMADGLPLIIWVHDETGAQQMVNETFRRFFGVSEEAMRGGGWQALIHPDDAIAYGAAFMQAVRDRSPFHAESRAQDAEGRWRYLESFGQPRFAPDGTFLGHVGASVDVTDRREGEAALRGWAERLEQEDRRKDQFLAMLAHELRNPLAPIQNAVAVLVKAGDPSPLMVRMRDVIARQVRHLARLVDDLLEVSRVNQGKVTLRLARLDVHDVVLAGVELARPLIDGKHHTLTVDVARPGTVYVDGDATRLAQCVGNLLNNAAKYTDERGRIRLAVSADAERVVIEVEDNGIGIAPDLLSDVFELFTQADRSIDRAQGGLGIGLSLVRSLVQLHRGHVRAASDGAGRGSLFTVELPRVA